MQRDEAIKTLEHISSVATPNATLLLKLAAAEQRIAEKDAALDRIATTAERSIGLQILAIEDNVFEIARMAKEGRAK